MSNRYLCAFAIAVAVLAMAGCASTELTIHVDLYDEDPRITEPMTPEEAEEMIAALATLRFAIEQNFERRLTLAKKSVEIYEGTLTNAGAPEGTSSKVRGDLETYVQKLETAKNNLLGANGAIENANGKLAKYSKKYTKQFDSMRKEFDGDEEERVEAETTKCSSFWRRVFGGCKPKSPYLGEEKVVRKLPPTLRSLEAEALAAVANATSAYQSFTGPVPFDFSVPWVDLRNTLYRALEAAYKGKDEARIERIKSAIYYLNSEVNALAKSERLKLPGLSKQVEATLDPSRSNLFGSAIDIAQELETLRNDLPEDASSRTALTSLVQSSARFFELIDRLQDAGDPVWRIVTDPVNEKHWNTKFLKTYYYAEGDSSVVVVRDNPMRYRVQQGTNNPTALIKGQLEISRSVTNAAIAVAGSATGLQTIEISKGNDASVLGFEGNTKAETLATRKANAEEEARFRDALLRNFSQYLADSISSLAVIKNDAKAVDNRSELLKLKLDGMKSVLETAL